MSLLMRPQTGFGAHYGAHEIAGLSPLVCPLISGLCPLVCPLISGLCPLVCPLISGSNFGVVPAKCLLEEFKEKSMGAPDGRAAKLVGAPNGRTDKISGRVVGAPTKSVGAPSGRTI